MCKAPTLGSRLHPLQGIEPLGYPRDLFCLLPSAATRPAPGHIAERAEAGTFILPLGLGTVARHDSSGHGDELEHRFARPVSSATTIIEASDRLELVFDTLDSSRKAMNLRDNPRIALVIGGFTLEEGRTVQYEGIADSPVGEERERLQQVYFQVFPDGRDRARQPGITYVRVRPAWLRYSNFLKDPWEICELSPRDLGLQPWPASPPERT